MHIAQLFDSKKIHLISYKHSNIPLTLLFTVVFTTSKPIANEYFPATRKLFQFTSIQSLKRIFQM